MYPVTSSKVYKSKVFVMPPGNMNQHHPFAFVSVFGLGLSQTAPLKGRQTTIELLHSVQKMALMLLTEVFLSDFFSALTVNSFLLLVCRASANKTSGRVELLRTGRGFGRVGKGS